MSNKLRTSVALREKLTELRTRREQLIAQLDEAVAAHNESQQRLIASDDEVAGVVAVHFATLSSMRESINSIDETVAQLTQQLADAERRESQEGVRTKLKRALKELGEAEDCYRRSRVQSDTALMMHVAAQVDEHVRWRQLQGEIVGLYQQLGEQPPTFGPIACSEPLTFVTQIDACAQQLLNVRRLQSTTRDERVERARERSARESAALANRKTRLRWHYAMREQPAEVEPPRVINGPGIPAAPAMNHRRLRDGCSQGSKASRSVKEDVSGGLS